MTRKFLAINIEVWAQSTYSAILVGVSALGITLGPGISSILEFIPQGTVAGTLLRSFNVFAIVFFFLWIIVFVLFIIFFVG